MAYGAESASDHVLNFRVQGNGTQTSIQTQVEPREACFLLLKNQVNLVQVHISGYFQGCLQDVLIQEGGSPLGHSSFSVASTHEEHLIACGCCPCFPQLTLTWISEISFFPHQPKLQVCAFY